MLTRHGWVSGLVALGLVGLGRLFGLIELYILGAGIGTLLALALASVAVSRLDLAVTRDVKPRRVHAGTISRATIELRNSRRGRTRVLRLLDPVTGTAGADLLVPPLKGGETASVAYRLPTHRRGIIEVGPLDIVLADPFGLTSVTTRGVGQVELTVFPHLDTIVPPRQAAGPDPTSGADHPSALGRSGDEFYALRQYVRGDDLRKVHWPSTARRGELVVKQNELPWQGRTTVALDVRRGAYREDVFERAVSAAASVLHASWHRGDLVRLLTSDGSDSNFGAGYAHIEALMELLAVIKQSNRGDLAGALGAVDRSGGTGAVVCITGEVRAADVLTLHKAAGSSGALTVVTFGATVSGAQRGRVGLVHVPVAERFAEQWQQTMGSVRRERVGIRTS